MSATATAVDEFLAGLPQPEPKEILKGRLAVFFDGKKWKASYKTTIGFLHVDLGGINSIHNQAAAEARADELEARG